MQWIKLHNYHEPDKILFVNPQMIILVFPCLDGKGCEIVVNTTPSQSILVAENMKQIVSQLLPNNN